MSFVDQISQKWRELEARERMILQCGAAAAALILFYAFIWQPWHKAIAHMEEALQPRRESLVWIRQQAELVEQTDAAPSIRRQGQNQSLLAVIESTAGASQVRDAIQQMVPNSTGDEVRVVLEQVNFNQWIRWIDALYRQYGVNIKQLSAERDDDQPNMAEIRLTFERR